MNDEEARRIEQALNIRRDERERFEAEIRRMTTEDFERIAKGEYCREHKDMLIGGVCPTCHKNSPWDAWFRALDWGQICWRGGAFVLVLVLIYVIFSNVVR